MNFGSLHLSLAILLSGSLAHAEGPPCLPELRKFASEQAALLSCNSLEIAKRILAGEEVVPKRIYHFGKKSRLESNYVDRNIPKDVWDNVIMGDQPGKNFALFPIRRGLYGTHNIETNSYYRSLKPDDLGLMEIQIRDECRKPARTATFQNLHEDIRFKKWAASKWSAEDVAYFSSECRSESYYFVYMDKKMGRQNKRCTEIAEAFLNDQKIQVLLDDFIPKSFYLRDRNCIENLRGRPEEVVQMFAENPSLSLRTCPRPPYIQGDPAIVIFNILAHQEIRASIDPVLLDQLTQNVTMLDGDFRDLARAATVGFVNCKKAGPSDDCRPAVEKAISHLIPNP